MRAWPLAFTLCLLFLVGCGSDDKKTTEPEPSNYLPQTSISNVIANLKTAYTGMDSVGYAELFDPSFTFVFAPQDVGGPLNIPATWGLADELASAGHMLGGVMNREGYYADTLMLAFTPGAADTSDVDPSWQEVVLSNVQLDVWSKNTANDYLIYLISGHRADLHFVRTDETAPGTNEKIWKIVRWDDKPVFRTTPLVQTTTWGQIRAIWR